MSFTWGKSKEDSELSFSKPKVLLGWNMQLPLGINQSQEAFRGAVIQELKAACMIPLSALACGLLNALKLWQRVQLHPQPHAAFGVAMAAAVHEECQSHNERSEESLSEKLSFWDFVFRLFFLTVAFYRGLQNILCAYRCAHSQPALQSSHFCACSCGSDVHGACSTLPSRGVMAARAGTKWAGAAWDSQRRRTRCCWAMAVCCTQLQWRHWGFCQRDILLNLVVQATAKAIQWGNKDERLQVRNLCDLLSQENVLICFCWDIPLHWLSCSFWHKPVFLLVGKVGGLETASPNFKAHFHRKR